MQGRGVERAVRGRLVPLRQRTLRYEEHLGRAIARRVERPRQALTAAAGKLEVLSPLAVLGRGYAVALGEGGRVLRRVADFAPGVPFTLRIADGQVECEVTGEGDEP